MSSYRCLPDTAAGARVASRLLVLLGGLLGGFACGSDDAEKAPWDEPSTGTGGHTMTPEQQPEEECADDCTVAPAPSCTDRDTVLVSRAGRCEEGECRFDVSETPCPQGCDADEGACNSCVHLCPEAGAARCLDGELSVCEPDAEGCRDWSAPVPCARGACGDDASCLDCEDTCPGPGETACDAGNVVTCELGASGCLEWGAAQTCEDGFCADATSCGSCDHGCPALGATSCEDGSIRSCVASSQGCRQWTQPVSCPEATCANPAACELSERFCTTDDWCWLNPLPHAQNIDVVHGTAGDHVIASAQDLGLMSFDGATWRQIPGPVGQRYPFKALGGTGPSDIWACELYTFHHYDGAQWTTSPYGQPIDCDALWSSNAQNVYAAGGSVISRYDGVRWTQVQTPVTTHSLNAVAGTGPANVWVTGSNRVLHWDGTSWDPDPFGLGTSSQPDYVLTADPGEVWLQASSLLRFTGAPGSWSSETVTGSAAGFAVAASDAWFVGSSSAPRHYQDGVWSSPALPRTASLRDFWGSNPSDVWAVGGQGALFHWDGDSWRDARVGATPHFVDLWVQGTTRVALDMHAQLWLWNGATWEVWVSPDEAFYPQGLHGTAPDDLWIVGEAAVLHFDGETLTDRSSPVGGTPSDVFALARNDVWLSTFQGEMLHWDGAEWSVHPVDNLGLYALHGSRADDLWAVGSNCAFHYDGQSWQRADAACTSRLVAVFALAPDDVWVAGGRRAHHWDGSTWSNHTVELNISVNDLWASGPSDVYAVGNFGRMARFNGVEWTKLVSGTGNGFTAVFGTGPADVWTVGSSGQTLHRAVAPRPCDGMSCSGHGTCVEANGGSTSCVCEPGFVAAGMACAAAPDPCAGVDCSEGGVCFRQDQTPKCACGPGLVYDGAACSLGEDQSALACSDGLDDDGDGYVDCEDADCQQALGCRRSLAGTYGRLSGSGLETLVFEEDGSCQRQAAQGGSFVDCLYEETLPAHSRLPSTLVIRTAEGSPWDTFEVRAQGDLVRLDGGTTSNLLLARRTPLALGGGAPDQVIDFGFAEDEELRPVPTAQPGAWHVVLDAGGTVRVQTSSDSGVAVASTVHLAGPLVDGVPAALVSPSSPEEGYAAVFQAAAPGEYLLLVDPASLCNLRVRRFDAQGRPTRYFTDRVWHSVDWGAEARSVGVGDLNGDGRDDVALAMSNGSAPFAHKTLVHLQNADGTLADPVAYEFGSAGEHLLMLDANGDGHLDVVHSGNNLLIYAGNGDGTLSGPQRFWPGLSQITWAVNPAGTIDFVGGGSNALRTHHGDGLGDFSWVTQQDIPRSTTGGLAAADLDGDGVTDFALASTRTGGATLSVIDGVTRHITDYALHAGGVHVAIGDVRGDAQPEILVGHVGETGIPREVDVFARAQDGSYSVVDAFPLSNLTDQPLLVDLDGPQLDGRQKARRTAEFIVRRSESILDIHRFLEGRWIRTETRIPSSQGMTGLAVGDPNGDGCTDIVAASRFRRLIIAYGACPAE